MVRNVKSFQPISQGKPQQALWIIDKSAGANGAGRGNRGAQAQAQDEDSDLEIYYVQGTVITFLCPMRYA